MSKRITPPALKKFTAKSIKQMCDCVVLEDYRPHKVSELICVKCGKRFIGCRPLGTKLKDMDCPNLNCQSRGYIIETGEVLDDEHLNQ